jgi:hypothetical protein
LEVAIAGLGLILAGGVYRPLPIEAKVQGFEAVLNSCAGPLACPEGDEVNGIDRCLDRKSVIGLTPRERQVLAEFRLMASYADGRELIGE